MLLILCILAGCQSTPQPSKVSIPDWITRMPSDDQFYYALGVSGQTRRVNDAWNQAAQRARAELGRMIVTQITSRDLNIITNRSEYNRQVIESLSDTELNLTEVKERWFDETGAFGPKNHYYVLVRMEKAQVRLMLNRLKD
jgi:hypothetical protein